MRLLTSEFLGCLSIRLERTHSMDAPSDCDLGSCGFEAFGFFFLSASVEVLEHSMLSIFS